MNALYLIALTLSGIYPGNTATERPPEPADPVKSPIVITRDFLRPDRINPYQYGQFIEYLCTMVPAMWAEKLFDGSFEGLSPYKVAYLKETDFRERPWFPSGATNRATFDRDRSTKVSGEQSYKIATVGETPCTVSIAQDGIAMQQGLACDFACSMKQTGIKGKVRVRLHRDATVYAAADLEPTDDWSKVRARLVPSQTDTNVTLTIEFRGPGTLWLDNASLMPVDAKGGWRADVVAAVKAMRPGSFASAAARSTTRTWANSNGAIRSATRTTVARSAPGAAFSPPAPASKSSSSSAGWLTPSRLICVRFSRRDPQDAAELVQYLNGAVETKMGALRAKNGHPEPYQRAVLANRQRAPRPGLRSSPGGVL